MKNKSNPIEGIIDIGAAIFKAAWTVLVVWIAWTIIRKVAAFLWWLASNLIAGARYVFCKAFEIKPGASLVMTKVMVLMMVGGFLFHPLYLKLAVMYPTAYAWNMGKAAYHANEVKNDVVDAVVPDKVEEYWDRSSGAKVIRHTYSTVAQAHDTRKVHWIHQMLSPIKNIGKVVGL